MKQGTRGEGVSPDGSHTPEWDLPHFADGFGGGLIGGLLYCMLLAYFNPGELVLAWQRVITLALALGCFEVWRARKRASGPRGK